MAQRRGPHPAQGLFPLVWNLIAYAASDWTRRIAIFSENRFLTDAPGAYGSGEWYKFAVYSWIIHGPIILALALPGIPAVWRRGDRLIPVLILAFYLLHSTLWAGGWMQTGGYNRFFAAIAPPRCTHGRCGR